MNVPEALSRKVGPLPAGAWILAIVGGVGVAVVIRRGAGESGAYDEGYEAGEQAGFDSVAGNDADAGAGGYGPGLGGAATSSPNNPGTITYYVPGPTQTIVKNTNTPPPKPAKPKTNAKWRELVTTWLIKYKRYRRALVETSLDRWFAGKDLNPTQQNVISEAVAYLGPPPNPPRKRRRPGTRREDVSGVPSRRDAGTDTNPERVIVP